MKMQKAVMSERQLSKERSPIQGLQYLVHKGYMHKGKLASVDSKAESVLKKEKIFRSIQNTN